MFAFMPVFVFVFSVTVGSCIKAVLFSNRYVRDWCGDTCQALGSVVLIPRPGRAGVRPKLFCSSPLPLRKKIADHSAVQPRAWRKKLGLRPGLHLCYANTALIARNLALIALVDDLSRLRPSSFGSLKNKLPPPFLFYKPPGLLLGVFSLFIG